MKMVILIIEKPISKWTLMVLCLFYSMIGNAVESENGFGKAEQLFEKYFQSPIQGKNSIIKLSGGFSEASKFCLTLGNKRYVLRVFEPDYSSASIKREFFALEESSRIGIAPHIHAIYIEDRAVIMDFVDVQTITSEQVHQAVNRVKVAEALRKLHATKPNPHVQISFKNKLENRCAMLTELMNNNAALLEAMDIIRNQSESLEKANSLKVNIHGDLNPRNIFITEERALLIDWSEVGSEHPYFDLTGFALLHGYSEEEEALFLADYLQREPTFDESREFLIVKKIYLAAISISCQGVALGLLAKEPQKIDTTTHLKDWSFYVSSFFADNDRSLSAQFFSEVSRSALARAKF